jgi:hypothetical protein
MIEQDTVAADMIEYAPLVSLNCSGLIT